MIDVEMKKILERWKLSAAKHVPPYVSANMISVIGTLLCVISAIIYVYEYTISSVVIGVIGIITDGLDGGVARLRGTQSDYGAYIDLVSDFVTYCIYPMMMAIRHDTKSQYISAMFILLVFCVNTTSCLFFMVIETRQEVLYKKDIENEKEQLKKISLPRSLCEATETYIYLILCIIIPSYQTHLNYIYGFMCIIGILHRTHVLYRCICT